MAAFAETLCYFSQVVGDADVQHLYNIANNSPLGTYHSCQLCKIMFVPIALKCRQGHIFVCIMCLKLSLNNIRKIAMVRNYCNNVVSDFFPWLDSDIINVLHSVIDIVCVDDFISNIINMPRTIYRIYYEEPQKNI